jgi:hypothetical protein
MWPIVPMFTWGLFRSNFFLAISSPLLDYSPRYPGDDLLGDIGGHLVVGVQLHGAVRGAALGTRPQLGGVTEELGQRHEHADVFWPLRSSMFSMRPRRAVTSPITSPEELLGRGDLELHHGSSRTGSARRAASFTPWSRRS